LKECVLFDPDILIRNLAPEVGGPPDKLKKLLKRNEEQCKRWSLDAFTLDETDPSNYDTVISLSQIDSDEKVNTTTNIAEHRKV